MEVAIITEIEQRMALSVHLAVHGGLRLYQSRHKTVPTLATCGSIPAFHGISAQIAQCAEGRVVR